MPRAARSTSGRCAGTTSDQTIGSITYNPASQIQSQVRSNDAYAWTGHYNVGRNYTVNGLNQQTAAGATALGYDARGNLTTSGASTYSYNKLNQLTAGPGGVALSYDPAQRLSQITSSAGTTRFAYAGSALIQENNGSGVILRRYVPGPGTDEPVVWYEGSTTADRRWLHADERGSVIAVSNGSGAMLSINRYDEYGIPQSSNAGRFQYTGQAWLPELGMYTYKARMYSPTLGRFMQTDPIGYGDGMNWYNYVGGDPVNFADPSGTAAVCEDGTFIPDGAPRGCEESGHGKTVEIIAGAANAGDLGGEYWVAFWTSYEDPLKPKNPGEVPIHLQLGICQDLHKDVSHAKASLPTRVTDPKVWNDPAALKFYRQRYGDNKSDANGVVIVSGFVTAANGLNKSATSPVIDKIAFTTAFVGALGVDHYKGFEDAINIRLYQLSKIADGDCQAIPGEGI